MVRTIRLEKQGDLRVELTDVGAAIRRIQVPHDGKYVDATLTMESDADYMENVNYCGSVVGRFANRIANAAFRIDGELFELDANDGFRVHNLHGGTRGFHRRTWQVIEAAGNDRVSFVYESADREEGFPGSLTTQVTYSLAGAGTLRIEFEATTDKPTVVNLTNHAYFNLHGDKGSGLDGHNVAIRASRYTPTDSQGIPYGTTEAVAHSPLDLRKPANIWPRISSEDEQIQRFGGYDHNFVLDEVERESTAVAYAESSLSGLAMEVFTSYPGMQFYTAQHVTRPLSRFGGFCLEPQYFPDSPNQARFDAPVLRPGEIYREFIALRFSAR